MIYKNLVFLLLILGLALADVPADGAKPVLTDQAIGDHIQDELEADPGVSAVKVNVVVNNGVVTLTGEVNNLLAKERAVAIAEAVKGVRAVVDTMKVVPPFLLRDWEIKENVEEALIEDPATDSYEVKVTVSGNVATLTGTVQSWSEYRAARANAYEGGAIFVHNRLRLETSDQ
jgi:osmotically-inducible protein OsmY